MRVSAADHIRVERLVNSILPALGSLGGRVRCGFVDEQGMSLTMCGWADHGSVGLGVFLNRPIDESALLFLHIRQQVVTR